MQDRKAPLHGKVHAADQNEQLGTLPDIVKLDVVTPVPDGTSFDLYSPTLAYWSPLCAVASRLTLARYALTGKLALRPSIFVYAPDTDCVEYAPLTTMFDSDGLPPVVHAL